MRLYRAVALTRAQVVLEHSQPCLPTDSVTAYILGPLPSLKQDAKASSNPASMVHRVQVVCNLETLFRLPRIPYECFLQRQSRHRLRSPGILCCDFEDHLEWRLTWCRTHAIGSIADEAGYSQFLGASMDGLNLGQLDCLAFCLHCKMNPGCVRLLARRHFLLHHWSRLQIHPQSLLRDDYVVSIGSAKV